jgi:hypothetical protein
MTVRRLKTYASSQGYVYQYYFVRSGPASDESDDAMEYVFDVTSDRATTYSVAIVVPHAAMREWAMRHQRELSEAEKYAAVKMRLFRVFDGEQNMRSEGRRVRMETGFLEEALAGLGVE